MHRHWFPQLHIHILEDLLGKVLDDLRPNCSLLSKWL